MLKIAGGSVTINPAQPVVMGCGESLEPVGDIHDDIECNVVVLMEGVTRAVLVGVDALYPGPTLRQYLEERFAEALSPHQIFLAASHTHSAPQLDSTKPALGGVDGSHLDGVCRSIGDLVGDLLQLPGEEVRVEVRRYSSSVMVNRRRKRIVGGAEGRIRFNSVVSAPNPHATGRQYGHLVTFVGDRGPIAFVWQLPCHPVSLPTGWANSAHFPGVGRQYLRQSSSQAPVVFLQGFSGDLRPPSVPKPTGAKGIARRLLLGAWFSSFTESDYGRWTSEVVAELAGAVGRSRVSKSLDEPVSAKRVSMPLDNYHEGACGDRSLTVHRLSVGGVALLGVSAEPVSGYADALIAEQGRTVIPVGCIDDVSGYAPTSRVLRDGGYEGAGFAPHFGLGQPSSEFEKLLRRQMADALS